VKIVQIHRDKGLKRKVIKVREYGTHYVLVKLSRYVSKTKQKLKNILTAKN